MVSLLVGVQESDWADAADGKAEHHSSQNESHDDTEASLSLDFYFVFNCFSCLCPTRRR